MDQFPAAWRPSPGERIRGKVVDLDVRHGDYGAYPIITLETDGGERVAVHAFHDVLQNELARRSPKPGDQLEVSYAGKHPEKGYHVYRIASDGDVKFDWGQFGGFSNGGDDNGPETESSANDEPPF